MAIRISDALNIDLDNFESTGAFNGFVDLDSLFYIDPYLLRKVTTPELNNSYKKFRNYFKVVVKLIDNSSTLGDPFWRRALQLLIFKEIPNLGLGYSKNDNKGNAIGIKLAKNLIVTASEIIQKGITDPELFELVGLIEEGVGADRISDMTCRIILEDLLTFTQRITSTLQLKRTTYIKFKDIKYKVPRYIKPIILIPNEILTPLPVAYDWQDIDVICTHNEELRKRVNDIIGNTWKKATNKNRVSKSYLKSVFLEHPELIVDLIDQYKRKPVDRYDFKNDPKGEIIWYQDAKNYASIYPLDLKKYEKVDKKNIVKVVREICIQFRTLIENNGLVKLLYNDDNKRRHEKYPQLLFYGVADSYCKANNLDLSAEPNAGRGPVDFKLSKGYDTRVNVEVKYSSNPKLLKGYEVQLPIYDKAEKSSHSIYLVIRTTESTANIENLNKLRDETVKAGKRAPEIIEIDGRIQESASKSTAV